MVRRSGDLADWVTYNRMSHKQKYRSHDAYVAGVCAGIAERHDFDPLAIRVLFVLFTITTVGLGAVVYVLLWAYLPRSPEPSETYEVTPEHAVSIARGYLDYPASGERDSDDDMQDYGHLSIVARLAIAVGLMVLFLLIAMTISPIVSGTRWWQFWPIAFLIAGLCLIVIPVPSKFGAAWHAMGIVVMSLGATALPISLGVSSWETLPYALSHLWILLIAAGVLLGVGLLKRVDALVYAAALCVAAFCAIALLSFSVPGDVESLLVNMPDGRLLRIAFLSLP